MEYVYICKVAKISTYADVLGHIFAKNRLCKVMVGQKLTIMHLRGKCLQTDIEVYSGISVVVAM